MLFDRFEVPGLAHYSYGVGCPGAGEAAIVDPERNTDRYLDWASENDLMITHVLETHIHADYASGAKELAERTGAELALSDYDDNELYEVVFDHRALKDGEAVEVGKVRIEALHTPGHTPEHLSFLVYDTARTSDVPAILVSGDFLFVGSLGRPDLLGEEAKLALAQELFGSVRDKLAGLPDGLEIAPAHGAGSMCGAGLSGRPTSTLGFERVANFYLDPGLGEQQFIDAILGSVPPFPPYYRRMKVLNSDGPDAVAERPIPRALSPHEFEQTIGSEGAVVIDLREQVAFGGAHIPDSLGIGAGTGLVTWASWFVPYERPILLVPAQEDEVVPATQCLYRVGLDNVIGYLKGGIASWNDDGLPLDELRQFSCQQLQEYIQSGEPIRVLDVRDAGEYAAGHIEGATHVQGGDLAESLAGIPEGDGPLAVICNSGYRSTAAASLLRQQGFTDLINVTSGMNGWRHAGLPLVTG